jgi:hypothetical protein
MNGWTLESGLALGEAGLDFADLPGADGQSYSLGSFGASEALAVVFVASGCPTVRYYTDRLAALQGSRGAEGLQIVAVNANNPHLSSLDDLREMRRRFAETPWPFPYVKDPDGDLARRCGAICTPHAFLFDGERRLRYRGRIDDSRTGRRVSRPDLESAVVDVIAGRHVRVPETDPFGCAIVW